MHVGAESICFGILTRSVWDPSFVTAEVGRQDEAEVSFTGGWLVPRKANSTLRSPGSFIALFEDSTVTKTLAGAEPFLTAKARPVGIFNRKLVLRRAFEKID